MTPGILPGVHAHIDSDTEQPILVRSPRPEDFVQGMLVFGLGKEARGVLRAYYGRFAHRHRFPVELEVRVGQDGQYHLERRAIWAYVWLKSSKIDGKSCFAVRNKNIRYRMPNVKNSTLAY